VPARPQVQDSCATSTAANLHGYPTAVGAADHRLDSGQLRPGVHQRTRPVRCASCEGLRGVAKRSDGRDVAEDIRYDNGAGWVGEDRQALNAPWATGPCRAERRASRRSYKPTRGRTRRSHAR